MKDLKGKVAAITGLCDDALSQDIEYPCTII
jgi:hypothetical protein